MLESDSTLTKLGEGSYGCIYKNLKCPTSVPLPYGTVAKVFKNKDDYDSSLIVMKKILQLDPHKLYHINITSNCQLTPEHEYFNDVKSSCKGGEEEDIFMINMRNGGHSLLSFIKKIKTGRDVSIGNVIDFWYKSHYMIIFLNILNMNGFYHGDIKEDNIMFDYLYENRHDVNRQNLKIIDFDLFNELHLIDGVYIHEIYPPEQCLLKVVPGREYINLLSYYSSLGTSDTDTEYIQALNYFFDVFKIKRSHDNVQFEKRELGNVNVNQVNYQKMLYSFFNTMDIFSMGIVLHKMLNATIYIYPLLPIESVHIRAISYFTEEMKDLIFKMKHPNFNKRIHFFDLLIEYRRVLDILTPVFSYYGFNPEEMNSRFEEQIRGREREWERERERERERKRLLYAFEQQSLLEKEENRRRYLEQQERLDRALEGQSMLEKEQAWSERKAQSSTHQVSLVLNQRNINSIITYIKNNVENFMKYNEIPQCDDIIINYDRITPSYINNGHKKMYIFYENIINSCKFSLISVDEDIEIMKEKITEMCELKDYSLIVESGRNLIENTISEILHSNGYNDLYSHPILLIYHTGDVNFDVIRLTEIEEELLVEKKDFISEYMKRKGGKKRTKQIKKVKISRRKSHSRKNKTRGHRRRT